MAVSTRGKPIEVSPVVPLVDRIVEACHPVQVWLFGSRARGEARPDSDWDLLIVMTDGTTEVEGTYAKASEAKRGAKEEMTEAASLDARLVSARRLFELPLAAAPASLCLRPARLEEAGAGEYAHGGSR